MPKSLYKGWTLIWRSETKTSNRITNIMRDRSACRPCSPRKILCCLGVYWFFPRQRLSQGVLPCEDSLVKHYFPDLKLGYMAPNIFGPRKAVEFEMASCLQLRIKHMEGAERANANWSLSVPSCLFSYIFLNVFHHPCSFFFNPFYVQLFTNAFLIFKNIFNWKIS